MDQGIVNSLRIVADISIISFFIYTLFLSIRKFYISYHVFGLMLLTSIYFISQALDLPLTRTASTYLFQLPILVWVIIFQKEIKKYLEMLPSYIVKVVKKTKDSAVVDEIMEAVKYMAAHKIGALIIFTGQESIYRYCLRKVRLNGAISRQLLISLFEKSSPTHDGGVIINGTLIESFGAVFSLVEQLKNNKNGTRHHAAIELSNKTDALIVVVSEEKGRIAYAKRGQVVKPTQEELRHEIEQFAYSDAQHRSYIAERLKSEVVYYILIWIMVMIFRMNFM